MPEESCVSAVSGFSPADPGNINPTIRQEWFTLRVTRHIHPMIRVVAVPMDPAVVCTQPCHAAGMLRAALSCCSLTPTAFQFTTQPNSTPKKSIFISRERLCAYSTAVGEGPGEEGRTPSSINAAAASLYPTHLQIPELCEEKGDFGVLISMPRAWKHREAGEVEALTGGDEQGHSHPSAVPRSWPRCRSPAAQGSRCRGAGLRKTRNKNL